MGVIGRFFSVDARNGDIWFNGKCSSELGIVVEEYPEMSRGTRRGNIYQIAGRNGDHVQEDYTFDNYTQTYKIAIMEEGFSSPDPAAWTAAVASWLLGSSGYCRLEDSFSPNLFRYARFAGPLNIAQLMDQCDFTQEEVAKRLGKSRPAVANLLRLLTLPSSVCDLIREGVLSAGHARVLAGLDDVERQRQLADETVSKGYSVRQLEEIAAMTREEKPRKHARSEQETLSSELSQLETRLREAMGVRVTLKGSDTRGRIILQYYTRDELEHVNELLEKLISQED